MTSGINDKSKALESRVEVMKNIFRLWIEKCVDASIYVDRAYRTGSASS